MNRIVVSVGSNSLDREEQMQKALEWLARELTDVFASEVYETPAFGGGDPYLNAVLAGNTTESHDALNARLKDYELQSGRTPEVRSRGIVPIDIDIVIFDDKVLRPSDFARDFFRIGFEQLL